MKELLIILCLIIAGTLCSNGTQTNTPASGQFSKARWVELAEKYAATDSNYWPTVSNVLRFFRADTNQTARTVKLDPPRRTIQFIQNLIPCDGPLTTITVVLREDGSLERMDKKVDWPEVPELLPQGPVTAERAKEIAMAEMRTPTSDAPYVRVGLPVLNTSNRVWVVTLAHPIAGAWQVEIDGKTGAVLSKRNLPSR